MHCSLKFLTYLPFLAIFRNTSVLWPSITLGDFALQSSLYYNCVQINHLFKGVKQFSASCTGKNCWNLLCTVGHAIIEAEALLVLVTSFFFLCVYFLNIYWLELQEITSNIWINTLVIDWKARRNNLCRTIDIIGIFRGCVGFKILKRLIVA